MKKTPSPPHSAEAEQAVLGGLLLDNRAWDRVGDRLIEEDFYRLDHRLIFRAIRELAEQGKPFDAITVAEQAERNGNLDDAGGLGYIGVLAKDAPGAANIKAYADIVRERARLRDILTAAKETIEQAMSSSADVGEVLEDAQRRFNDIGRPVGKGPRQFMEPLTNWVNQIDERANRENKLAGASTGFGALDGILGGLERQLVYILAARPGMAKTTLGFNIAENFAMRGEVAQVFELEMPHHQLMDRSVSNHARIDSDRLRRGDFRDGEWNAVVEVTNRMRNWPLYVDDQSGLSLMEIRTRARRLKRQRGLDLLVIDYLQLIRETAENRTNEITKISRGLKELAKELDVPVIALSQLSREVEKRHNKRPMPSDLRESGSIEQDADALLFLYRESAYDEETPYDDVAEVIIGKQRNGPMGTVYLHYTPEQFRFANLDHSRRIDYVRHVKGKQTRSGVATSDGFTV